ncbi:Hypothetical protein SMAX5B_007287 [Scophthalmus maximus]|uniref:Uncharacterized protein n=1 Tax=Scophthalmus maximus TaxID=52904 RepID=A0A2U9BNN8_SCOMX|nr:Hypothetical protein SMAX5B_007287 [Scophthalmus maximus]
MKKPSVCERTWPRRCLHGSVMNYRVTSLEKIQPQDELEWMKLTSPTEELLPSRRPQTR